MESWWDGQTGGASPGHWEMPTGMAVGGVVALFAGAALCALLGAKLCGRTKRDKQLAALKAQARLLPPTPPLFAITGLPGQDSVDSQAQKPTEAPQPTASDEPLYLVTPLLLRLSSGGRQGLARCRNPGPSTRPLTRAAPCATLEPTKTRRSSTGLSAFCAEVN